jgi:hypothetical protein
MKDFLSQLADNCGFNKDDCKLLFKNEPVDVSSTLADLDLSFDSVLHVLPNSSALLPSLQPLAQRQELMENNLIVDFGGEPRSGSLKVLVVKDEFKPNPHSSKLETDKLQIMFFVPSLVHEEAEYLLKQLNERIHQCRENQVNIWKMMHARETRIEPAEAKSTSFFNNMFDSVRESTLAGLVSPSIQRKGTGAISRGSGSSGSIRRGASNGEGDAMRAPDVETRKIALIPIPQVQSDEAVVAPLSSSPVTPSVFLPEPRQILREFAVKAVPRPPAKRNSGKLAGTSPPPPPPPPKPRASSMIELQAKGAIAERINAEIKAAEDAAAATLSSVIRTIDNASGDVSGARDPLVVPKKPSAVLLPSKKGSAKGKAVGGGGSPKIAPVKSFVPAEVTSPKKMRMCCGEMQQVGKFCFNCGKGVTEAVIDNTPLQSVGGTESGGSPLGSPKGMHSIAALPEPVLDGVNLRGKFAAGAAQFQQPASPQHSPQLKGVKKFSPVKKDVAKVVKKFVQPDVQRGGGVPPKPLEDERSQLIEAKKREDEQRREEEERKRKDENRRKRDEEESRRRDEEDRRRRDEADRRKREEDDRKLRVLEAEDAGRRKKKEDDDRAAAAAPVKKTSSDSSGQVPMRGGMSRDTMKQLGLLDDDEEEKVAPLVPIKPEVGAKHVFKAPPPPPGKRR